MAWEQTNNTQKDWSDGTSTEVTWQISQGATITYQQLDTQITDMVTNGKWSGTFITWDGIGMPSGMTLQWSDISSIGAWSDVTSPSTNPNWS